MKKINFTRFALFVHLLVGVIYFPANGQTPWSGAYGNEWIITGQQYVKVTVSTEGIQKVPIASLPEVFKLASNREKIQLWHRGEPVALIKVDDGNVDITTAEILFYGVLNDGKSDELLYRPGPSARFNTLVSLFSDNSAYFLTVGQANGLRAATISQSSVAEPSQVESFHMNTQNVVYKNLSTHDPNDAGRKPPLINSFYEEGRSLTGLLLAANGLLQTKNNMATTGTTDPTGLTKFRFNVENLSNASGALPKMKVLIQGRDIKSRVVKVHIVNGAGVSIRSAISTPTFSKYEYRLVEFDIVPGDYTESGEGFLAFEGISTQTFDLFSISYYGITYPQSFNMNGKSLKKFLLNSATESSSRVQISGATGGNTILYNVTNKLQPVIIEGSASNFKIPRSTGSSLELLATSERQLPTVMPVNLTKKSINPDYLIISTEALFDEAVEYGKYRASTRSAKGKGYNPMVVKITDVYNEFNYGEPSPVAIRRFVDYMLSGSDKQKYLLLIGKSISDEASTPRELVDNVPTIGYPGSDELLVDGLAGTPQDVPSIPVGRIPALTSDQVRIYREKVNEYEFGKVNTDFSWRKNVVHVSGGDNESQATSFKNYLASLPTDYAETKIVSSYWKVAPYTDKSQKVVINELKGSGKSDGAGLITYYGHGTTWRTDKNISYVADPDPSKNYVDSQKYCGLFFFGCDVNNIFRNRFGTSTSYNSMSQPMGMEWLFNPKKGAVVVFANTWDGYSTAFEPYMAKLYAKLFVQDQAKKPIGDLIKEVAASTVNPAGARIAADYDFHKANINQGLLLGDPAIILLYSVPVEKALPVVLKTFSAERGEGNRVLLKWTTSMEKNNSHFVIERSRDAKNYQKIGFVEGNGYVDRETKYETWDNSPMIGVNYYRLVQFDSKINEEEEKSEYSRSVSVNFTSEDLVIVAPNPTRSSIEIMTDSRIVVNSWSLTDVNGHVVKGIGTKVNMDKLIPGTYTLEIISNSDDLIRKKVIKN